MIKKVQINLDKLPVYMGASKKYPTNGEVKKDEIYKIYEEKNGFGHLKSNAGWIELKWCKGVS